MKTAVFDLTYNPYTVKFVLRINELELSCDPLSNWINDNMRNKRLQQWIDSFLEQIFVQGNTKEIDFLFTGTVLDSEDVKDAVFQFNRDNPGLKINVSFNHKTESVEEKVAKLKVLYKEAEQGPFEEFKSDEMKFLFAKALAPEFEVNVIATMSSGKSTVINAMLGTELMPAKNEACTATIAKISDYDDMPNFIAMRSNAKQEVIDDWQDANSGLIDLWNDDEQTSVIQIKGNIPAIKEREGVRIVLVDTPGPNNSRDVSHRQATMKAISDNGLSMVLYVLNATQLSTDDDASLLGIIRDTMKRGGREAQDRFIFIANKIDSFDPEKGESVTGAIENIRNYLKGKGIDNPLVIPASAELTKLIRISKFKGDDSLTRSQRGNLRSYVDLFVEEPEMNLVDRVKEQISTSTYNSLNNRLKSFRDKDDTLGEAEVLSGIPIVEILLDNFILKHALPAKLKDAVDSFSGIIAKAEGLEKLNRLIDQDSKDIEIIAKNLESFDKDQEKIDKAKEFREDLKGSKYKISHQAKQQIKAIERKVNDLLGDLEDLFIGNVTPSEAERNFRRAERESENLFDNIEDILAANLKEEMVTNLDGLRDRYEQHISSLLNQKFPEGTDISVREFQAASMKMPDAKSLINSSTFTKRDKKKVGTERCGFLWLKKRNIYETTETKLVNMSEPWGHLESSIRTTQGKNRESFEKNACANYKDAKAILMDKMDEIDNKLTSLIEDISNASKNKDEKERMLKENEAKKEWYKGFMNKLDKILAI